MMLPPPTPGPVSMAATAATRVLSSAQGYQNNASAYRLGKTITLSSSNQNLPKVKGIIQERNHARALLQKDDPRISVDASLWKVGASSKKEQAIASTRVNQAFPETDLCHTVVSYLFDLIKDSLQKSGGPISDFKYLGDRLHL